jgi:hypothetical protein
MGQSHYAAITSSQDVHLKASVYEHREGSSCGKAAADACVCLSALLLLAPNEEGCSK